MKFKDILFKFTVEEIHQCWIDMYNDKIPKEAVELIVLQMRDKELKEGEGFIKVDLEDNAYASLYILGEPCGFSFTPWGQILNTDIQLVNVTELKAVAIILYEITWYGVEEEAIQAEMEELRKRLKEVEEGNAKTYTLDELDELFNK